MSSFLLSSSETKHKDKYEKSGQKYLGLGNNTKSIKELRQEIRSKTQSELYEREAI